MADSIAPVTAERTGVHPSRALMVIPQPPRRSVWRAAASAAGRALVLLFMLPFLLPAFAVRAVFALARGTVRAASEGGRGLAHAAWLVLRGAGLGAWLALRGAGRVGFGLARLVGRGAVALNAGVAAGAHGVVAGIRWTLRSMVRLAAATTVLAAYLVAGLVSITANVVRALGVALLAGAAAASYGFMQALRILGLALLGFARGVVATVVAVARAVAAVVRVVALAVATVARAVTLAVRGVFVALRGVARFLAPARPGAAVGVAAGAYALLAGVEHFVPFLGHALVGTPAAVVVLLLVGFVVAALYGHASRGVALGLLMLLCIGGIRIGADVAARGAWGAAAAAAVFALFAGQAAWRFGRAFALPITARSPAIEHAHRDAGLGLVCVLLGQLAVCAVWFIGLDAAERTAALVIDLASAQLVLVALGGWFAASVARGRHLRGAQVTLVGALVLVLVLVVAASLQAIGHRHGATADSIALGGLLVITAAALCLVVRARIADGSYAPVTRGSTGVAA